MAASWPIPSRTTKLSALIAAVPELTVIADFDRTLTGAKSASAHRVVAGVLSEPFRDVDASFRPLLPHRTEFEYAFTEKIPLMEEWYRADRLTMVRSTCRGT